MDGGRVTTLTLPTQPKRLEAIWGTHGAALTREATAAHFTPVAADWFDATGQLRDDANDVPQDRDEAREIWSRAILDTYGY